MKNIQTFIKESTNNNYYYSDIDKFFYDIAWYENVGFESKEECNYVMDKLQNEYNFKSTKSYDDKRKTSIVIFKGNPPKKDKNREKEDVTITLTFYPNGDEYNEEPWCDLTDVKK